MRTANARRATAVDVSTTPPTSLRRRRHRVGRRRIERPAKVTRPLYLVRQLGRDDAMGGWEVLKGPLWASGR
jgi:hypothetical protein